MFDWPACKTCKVIDALERAEKELKTATESLSLVGQQLDSLRSVVSDGDAQAKTKGQLCPPKPAASNCKL